MGFYKLRNHRYEILFYSDISSYKSAENANQAVVIYLQGNAESLSLPAIQISNLLLSEFELLSIDNKYLQNAIMHHKNSNEIALSIELINSEIIIVNSVTDKRKTIAKTDFGSNNDSAFEYIFAQAGKTLQERQVIEGAEIEAKTIDLQKLVEQLGFKGNLRKLFFRVSKKQIRFNHTATHKQISSLGIDIKSLF